MDADDNSTLKLEVLSNRKIISNMAIIFVETDFWGEMNANKNMDVNKNLSRDNRLKMYKMYFERIKKRLEAWKKRDEESRIQHIYYQ